MFKHLVIGMGEIGTPIHKILSECYETASYDQLDKEFSQDKYDVIHICFGHKESESDQFIGWVEEYQARFLKESGLTVIHSTVNLGVSRQLNAVHSPVRGQHPNMEAGIRTFVKYFGGERASEAAELFRRAGLKVCIYDKPETAEALKLFDTQYYLECVRFCQRVKSFADKHGLNFHEVYTLPNQSYNEGYTKLGRSDYVRPVLQPITQPVGGHCLIPNEKLLKAQE